MGFETVTKALVLHEMPISEYDKRLILLTKSYGKITVFVKGARKPNSHFLAGSQVFCYGDYTLFKGRQNYNLNGINLVEPFHKLRQDIDTLAYGLYILEFTDFISEENEPNHELMQLVLKTLKQLEALSIPCELIARIFELKAMSMIGYSPWVQSCLKCGKEEGHHFFSSKEGGVVCGDCIHESHQAVPISEGTRYAMGYILGKPLNDLFKFKLEKKTLEEFNLVMKQFIDYNLNRKFKALQFLSTDNPFGFSKE